MKIFIGGKTNCWNGKNNFVDDNNVFLGYDEYDDCCSDGGWFISDKADEWLRESFKEEPMELPGFNFDTKYFKELANDCLDSGGAVQFRITNGTDEKFIYLKSIMNLHQ